MGKISITAINCLQYWSLKNKLKSIDFIYSHAYLFIPIPVKLKVLEA
jgi:hypothetical protein